MAITFNTDRLLGLEGTTINGVYARIQSVEVKKYDATTNPNVAASFRLMYDVILHTTAVKRNADGEYPQWNNRLRSREIDHFTATVTTDQMNAADANSYTLAYADLKTKLAADDPPKATSISDA
jgi:hypothetical protein|tara:strand:+ start:229 stop:600 length:372 start_codon:yes stop_codon:yes gene_type:complete